MLFVSHNMAAIENLCGRGILLESGRLAVIDEIRCVVDRYRVTDLNHVRNNYLGSDSIITKARIYSEFDTIRYGSSVKILAEFRSPIPITQLVFGLVVSDRDRVSILGINNRHYTNEKLNEDLVSEGCVEVTIPKLNIIPGEYTIDLYLGDATHNLEKLENALKFVVAEGTINPTSHVINHKLNKIFLSNIEWKLKQFDGV